MIKGHHFLTIFCHLHIDKKMVLVILKVSFIKLLSGFEFCNPNLAQLSTHTVERVWTARSFLILNSL